MYLHGEIFLEILELSFKVQDQLVNMGIAVQGMVNYIPIKHRDFHRELANVLYLNMKGDIDSLMEKSSKIVNDQATTEVYYEKPHQC